GACLVLMDAYDPLRALQLIERERCTVWNAVDAMVTAMLEHPDLDRYDRASLRTGGLGSTGGGAHGLFEAFVERIGVRDGYEPYGWFRSGDLGVQDGRGHTIFKGRLRETLRISHFMVAPGEIEAFLMSHPDVAQAFVVGVPDPKLNEAPVAYVILKEGAFLTE